MVISIELDFLDACAVVNFFRPRAAPAASAAEPRDCFEAFGRHMAEAYRADARALAAAFEGPGPAYAVDGDLVCRGIRELVDRGMELRAEAYARPDFPRDSVPGGFITRMFGHRLCPEAEELDRVALALANAIPGLDEHQRLALVT